MLSDYNSPGEVEQAGHDLIAGIVAAYPWLTGRVAIRTGTHPITGKHTLTLLLEPGTSYPLDVEGLVSFRGHWLTILRGRT